MDKVTVTSQLEPSQLPTGALEAYMPFIGLGGPDGEYARVCRKRVMSDPDREWEYEHGAFYQASDGSVIAHSDDYYFEATFATFDGSAWRKADDCASWMRCARAVAGFHRAQRKAQR